MFVSIRKEQVVTHDGTIFPTFGFLFDSCLFSSCIKPKYGPNRLDIRNIDSCISCRLLMEKFKKSRFEGTSEATQSHFGGTLRTFESNLEAFLQHFRAFLGHF